ncbi:heme peroxidase [Terramyces sp. JEL0728]|nr:heme peroxidase [Terramyces sp. JEL0728]
MTNAEWTELRMEIGNVFDAGRLPKQFFGTNLTNPPVFPVGPTIVRLAWHQAGTYNAQDGSGGPHGDVDMENAGNKGLARAVTSLAPIQEKWQGKISKADLWSFAASVYISNNFGPEIKWRPGRADHLVISGNASLANRLPDAAMNASQIKNIFYTMGFNDEEIVALQGAHTLGFASPWNSQYGGAWTLDNFSFDNDLFKRIVNIVESNVMNYTLDPGFIGPYNITVKPQFIGNDDTFMLPSDVLLITDPTWAPYSRKFATDKKYFYKKFAQAFEKLNELGVHHGLGKHVSTVIPGKQGQKYKVGSPVITKPVNLYYIYYGAWSESDIQRLAYVGNHMSNTSLYKSLKDYYYQKTEYSPRVYVDGRVTLKASTFVNYTMGRILYPGNTTSIISSVVGEGKALGTADPIGVYMFLFSPDVYEFSSFGAFCYDWCQYHSSINIEGVDIAYGSIGTHSPGVPPVLSGNYQKFGCKYCRAGNRGGPYDINTDNTFAYIIDNTARMILNPAGPSASWSDQFGREGSDSCSNGMYGSIDQLALNNDTTLPYNLMVGNLQVLAAELPDLKTGLCRL